MVAVSLSANEALREIIEILMRIPSVNSNDVNRVKMQVSAKHQLVGIPSNSEIIRLLRSEEKRKLLPVLRRKVTRTISGIVVIAVMTKTYLSLLRCVDYKTSLILICRS